MRRLVCLIACAAACMALPSVANAYVYWANTGGIPPTSGATTSTIGRVDLDGSDPQPSFISGADVTAPCGVAVNGSSVYWGNTDPGGSGGSIGEAKLDGTSPTTLPLTTQQPCGLSLDSNNVYWSEAQFTGLAGEIDDATLAGANPSTLVPSTSAGNVGCGGTAVAGGYLYWTHGNDGTNPAGVGRYKLDGTDTEPNFITFPTTNNLPAYACGVAVGGGYIFFAVNSQTNPTSLATIPGTEIERANLDGTGLTTIVNDADAPCGVATDGTHVFWANNGFGSGTTIGEANLDGSGDDESFVSGANAPCGVAADTLGPDNVPGPPTATLTAPDQVTTTSAVLHGEVDPDGAATSYAFEYVGPSGHVRTLTVHPHEGTPAVGGPVPTQGYSEVPVSATITGLQPDSTYQIELVAQNQYGEVTTPKQQLTTVNPYLKPGTTGTPTVGTAPGPVQVGTTAECDAPTFTADPGDTITVQYQWLRDGQPIDGTSGPGIDNGAIDQYTLTLADLGHTLTCSVVATDKAGSTDPIISGNSITVPASCTPVITKVSPNTGETPLGSAGVAPLGGSVYKETTSVVTITGSGFCAEDNVTFGTGLNSESSKSVQVLDNGDELQAVVPPLAQTGAVTVSIANGPSATWADTFTVTSFPGLNGFTFDDANPNVNFATLTGEYGSNQTIQCNTGGIKGCIPNPIVQAFDQVYAPYLQDNDFGMTLTAARLLEGTLRFSQFPGGGPDEVGLMPQSPELTQEFDQTQTAMLSTQYITDYSEESQHNADLQFQGKAGSAQVAGEIDQELDDILGAGRNPIVVLNGRAYEVYDVEGLPSAYTIYAYHPTGDGNPGPGPGTLDVITVNEMSACQQYACYQYQVNGGTPVVGLVDFIVIDPANIPIQPTLDYGWLTTLTNGVQRGNLARLHNAIASAVPDDATGATGATGTPPGEIIGTGGNEQVTQVTGDDGKTLLGANGTLNDDPSTRLPGTIMPAPPGTGQQTSSAQPLLLLPSDAGPITETVQDTGGGTGTQLALGQTSDATITTPSVTGATQKITLGSSSAGVQDSAGGQPLDVSVSRPDGGDDDTAELTTTTSAGGSNTLTVSNSGVEIQHTGPATTVAVTLSRNGAPAFSSGPISIAAGATATLTGVKWSGLAGASITVHSGHHSRKLKNHLKTKKRAGKKHSAKKHAAKQHHAKH